MCCLCSHGEVGYSMELLFVRCFFVHYTICILKEEKEKFKFFFVFCRKSPFGGVMNFVLTQTHDKRPSTRINQVQPISNPFFFP